MIKESILLEDITINSMRAPKNRASKYVRQTVIVLHKEIDKYIIVAGTLIPIFNQSIEPSNSKLSRL